MKKLQFTLALIVASASLLSAQVATEAVGFNSVTCLAGSDTRCSVPLTAETAFVGVVSSATVPLTGQLTIVPTATAPGWTANQFATAYYVKLTSGSKVGMYYQVVSNTATGITVDLAGDTAGIAATDGFKVCKFWTLASLFPPATQTTIAASLNNLANQRRTQVFFYNVSAPGINLPTNRAFFMVGPVSGGFVGTEWRESTASNATANNVIIPPDVFFVIRHPASVASTIYTHTGTVDLSPNTTPLNRLPNTKQDNIVTHGRPVPVKLSELDLIVTGAFTPSANNLANQRRDELFVYDNAAAGINKGPVAAYFYVSTPGEWRNSLNGNTKSDDDLIQPSQGFIIRKYQSGLSQSDSVLWSQSF